MSEMPLTDPAVIRELLGRHGFRFSKALGQNFLIDPDVPAAIADFAPFTEEDAVLEIGPGIGTLTVKLAERAGKVLCVELDERLRPIHKETLSDHPNVEAVFADAVKTDLAALCMAHDGEKRWHICANLPYNVTTPLLTSILRSRFFESVTVMIQREVAERILAAPGTADYGSFTVLCGWYAEVRRGFDVTPDCFMPQPKVTSSVLTLYRRSEPPCECGDEEFFFRCVRAAFNQRRKALPNALTAGINDITKDNVRRALLDMGLEETIRGERLSIPQFCELSELLLRRME